MNMTSHPCRRMYEYRYAIRIGVVRQGRRDASQLESVLYKIDTVVIIIIIIIKNICM
jgi:hypothetical protein